MARKETKRRRKGASASRSKPGSSARSRAKAAARSAPRGRSNSSSRSKKRAASRRSAPIASPSEGEVMERVLEAVESGVEDVRELASLAGEELGTFSKPRFMDRLSEFLEHERNAAKLYELGLEKEMSDEQRERLQDFLAQTRRHIEILTAAIADLGGDPEELSQAAQLNRLSWTALVETDAEGPLGVLDFFQRLVLAEYVDYMNWRFLSELVRRVDDPRIASVLERYLREVQDEEVEHFRWTEKQIERLSVADAFSAIAEPEAQAPETKEGEPGGERKPGEAA